VNNPAVNGEASSAARSTIIAIHPVLFADAWRPRRARLDLDHGFGDLAAGLQFDTGARDLQADFRRNFKWSGP
jgi:hypothetical protein